MKTVACVGCSWTYGYDLEKEDTYPAILSDRLRYTRVINAGHCGADIDYAIYSATQLIEKQEIDIVLFQLTTLDRLTLGTDGYDNFINDRYVDRRKEDIYSVDDRLLGIGDNIKTKIALGSYINQDKSREHKESNVHSTEKEYATFIKLLYENVVFSNYSFYKIRNNLKLFDSYAKSKNCRVYYFRWLESTPISVLCENLSYTETSVESFINSSFYIDNGYHLDKNGNTELVDKFIIPMLGDERGL
jgi:hypothetical protein